MAERNHIYTYLLYCGVPPQRAQDSGIGFDVRLERKGTGLGSFDNRPSRLGAMPKTLLSGALREGFTAALSNRRSAFRRI